MANWLLDSMSARGGRVAIAGPWGESTYAALVSAVDDWSSILAFVKPGAVVAFDAGYTPGSISLLLALACNRNILVPLGREAAPHHDTFVELSQAEYRITAVDSEPLMRSSGRRADHLLYAELRRRGKPGLVLFSSAGPGLPKYAVHDLSILLENHRVPGHSTREILLLPLDHLAGVNTLVSTLASGGSAVVPLSAGGSPDAAARLTRGGEVVEHPTAMR
jgi:long-chain acyl-CoA synthetase